MAIKALVCILFGYSDAHRNINLFISLITSALSCTAQWSCYGVTQPRTFCCVLQLGNDNKTISRVSGSRSELRKSDTRSMAISHTLSGGRNLWEIPLITEGFIPVRSNTITRMSIAHRFCGVWCMSVMRKTALSPEATLKPV